MLDQNKNVESINESAPVKNKRKRLWLILSLVLVGCIVASFSVYAAINYAKATAPAVTDTFEPAKVSCTVTSSGTTYTVKNTGNISAYVRVIVDANWVDSSGMSHWTEPSGYSVTASGWTKSGDYYYYNSPVAPNATVSITVAKGSATAPTTPSGFTTFNVKVAAEVIQSDPKSAATEAWGYTFS